MKDVIKETLEMMGFTFLVGMGVALIIKITAWSFVAFTRASITQAVKDWEKKMAESMIMQKRMEKEIVKIEKGSSLSIMQFMNANKNTDSSKENVENFYALFNYYRGEDREHDEKDKDDDGTNELIKYYYGEI